MDERRLSNAGITGGPHDLPECDVWPKSRAHLLEQGYEYEQVAAMFKGGMSVSEALLKFHYPSLFKDERVLFCDTGDHIVIYIAEKVDKVTPIR